MPDMPFIPNRAPDLLQMAGSNPLPQAGQTLGQGVSGALNAATQGGLAQKLMQLMQANNPNAKLLSSAQPMPGLGVPPAPPANSLARPGMPPQPGPMVPPGRPMNILPPGYGGQ